MSEPTSSSEADVAIDKIPRDECLALLAKTNVGRIGVVDGSQPVILPVNYTYTDDGIVVHTDPGVKLDAGRQRFVAFEIDEIDPAGKTGWSVLVKGHAYDVTETLDERSDRVRAVAVESWVPGERARRMVIGLTTVTGRRLRRESGGG